MGNRNMNIKGSISLEACVAVPAFMILMLFVYSFFIIFTAQNTISHALLQSCQSVSMDPYKTECLGTGDALPASIGDVIIKLVEGDNPNFVSDSKWYKTDDKTSFREAVVNIATGGFLKGTPEATVNGLTSDSMNQIAKDRFVGYLSGGDTAAAESKMEALNLVNGLDGIVFQAVVSGNDLYITATYDIEYVFSFSGAAKLKMTQTVCSRIWK